MLGFLHKMDRGYWVYHPSNIFRTHLVLKIGIITIPQFYPEKIQSCDTFKPVTCEQKSFMDYNYSYILPEVYVVVKI